MKDVLIQLSGAFLAVWSGILANWWQRGRTAKDEFRIFVVSKINEVPEKDFGSFYLTIKPQIGMAAEKLKLFLSNRKSRKINAALKAFCEIDYNKLQDQNEKSDWENEFYKMA
ncbi:MAG TPA: hypothetical protein VNX68_02910, partial [Nitrosopumilaceae archaeon]|nr:hypothetical protein [Nitrosopumilaceae archaeon]